MDKEPITSEGLKKVKKELEELKNTKRPKIIEAIPLVVKKAILTLLKSFGFIRVC